MILVFLPLFLMLVKNKTHYFCDYTKTYNVVPETNSFSYESSRRTAFMQRLSFEYDYTRSVDGVIFFYTLTYNDKAIPYYLGKPCFSYDDIRLVTNGVISKTLLRKYGSKLRYFCACESGDGKGFRGLGNNPHYHFIFFVSPAENSKVSYRKISALEFRRLVFNVWQGSCNCLWKDARFGHAQPGNFIGEVFSKDAFSYVSKYVNKTDLDFSRENDIRKYWFSYIVSQGLNFYSLYSYYKYLKWSNPNSSFRHLWSDFRFSVYNCFRHNVVGCKPSLRDWLDKSCGSAGRDFLKGFDKWFSEVFIHDFVDRQLSEYRCKYSGKVRCSKSLGVYGVNFIRNADTSPDVVVALSTGYKVQRPCLYYLRKLYYDVKICPYTGNPLYYLNERGLRLKVSQLPTSIFNLQTKVHEYLLFALNNSLFVDFKQPQFVNDDSTTDYDDSFLRSLCSRKDLSDIIRKYAIFRLVYQYRSYDPKSFCTRLDSSFSIDAIQEDYALFLKHNPYYLDFHLGTVHCLLDRSCVSFSSHPLFVDYSLEFEFLDCMFDAVSWHLSSSRRIEFFENSERAKRVNAFRYNSSFIV